LIRFLFLLAKFLVFVAIAVWLSDRAGKVTFEWRDTTLQTSAALLIGVLALMLYATHKLSTWLASLRTGPKLYHMHLRLRQHRQGEKLLGRALTELEASKPTKSLRSLARAEKLLGPSEVVEAIKSKVAAPSSASGVPLSWREMLGSEIRRKNWDGALAILEEQHGSETLPRKEWRALKAALLTEQARHALHHKHEPEAFEYAMQADRLRPHWPPALLLAAESLVAQGKIKEAARFIERQWDGTPHEQLGDFYMALRTGKTELQKAQAIEKMLRRSSGQPESRMVLARAYARAGLWGQARQIAQGLAQESPRAAVFVLLAEIEEREKRNTTAAHGWRERASAAAANPAWECTACKHRHVRWQALCAYCSAFDKLEWNAGKA
jgi:uncharacterized membrane-anchored protein